MLSSGVTTSICMIGSIKAGPAFSDALLNAWIAQISNDNWSESTGWNEPSINVTFSLSNG
jgi:hypothetical protein